MEKDSTLKMFYLLYFPYLESNPFYSFWVDWRGCRKLASGHRARGLL